MGNCFGNCCPMGLGGTRTGGWFSTYYDRGSLVEFESLMESTANLHQEIEPIGISSIMSFRKRKHARREEELELEEGALIEGKREAARVARLANNHQIINPARLVLRDSTSSWIGTDDVDINGFDEAEVFIDENKLRLLTSRTYLPSYSNSILETGSTISSNVSEGRDWINNNGSTPPSSIDLEWDEAGVFLPPDSNNDHVKRGTPISNDLEWDNDVVNVDVNNQSQVLDLETEQLISEIEKLTAEALADTNLSYR